MTEMGLELVQPCENHGRLVWQWHNDPATLRFSYHSSPVSWEQFYPRFLRYEFCFPNLPPLFATLEGEQIAYVSFSPAVHPWGEQRSCCVVSINVAPARRGQGLGTRVLQAIQPWVARQGYDDLIAEVKRENTISQQAFVKAGFQRLDETTKSLEDLDQTFDIVRYLMPLTPERKKEVFVIAEAGSNWCVGTTAQNDQMAKQLIAAAKEAGADAVKFQVFKPETTYVKNAGVSDYLAKAGVSEDIYAIFQKLEMPYEMFPQLAETCRQEGIELMISAFSPQDFAAIDSYVQRHKIASYEIGYLHLLHLAARSSKPLILSTGGATEFEIEWAVETFREAGGRDLTLLQCAARYPALPESMNLRVIPWLQHRFQTKSGLSDHSSAPLVAPVAAVAMGAQVIEKHFTMDRTLPGPDHAFAITVAELEQMVRAIREAEAMLGDQLKTVHPSEEHLRAFAHRGVQALCDIEVGEKFVEGENIAILRPGKQRIGVHPRFLPQIVGKSVLRRLTCGEGVQKGDWSA